MRLLKAPLDRARTVFIAAFTVLSILTVYQVWQDVGQQTQINATNDQLAKLCESGAVDCTGVRGLPGAKGIPGTGIRSVVCDPATQKFVITYTSGRIVSVGDCVAKDGAKGDRGVRGKMGPRGPRGYTGPRGPKGGKANVARASNKHSCPGKRRSC